MLNISKTQTMVLNSLVHAIILSTLIFCDVSARTLGKKPDSSCNTVAHQDVEHVTQEICSDGRTLRLGYDRGRSRINLSRDGQESVLQAIPSGYDPALVGADSLIGFLPEALQVYRKKRLILFLSPIRTSGGGGSGQCGAGTEIYLSFLDVGRANPEVRSRILIGSCRDSIELEDQDIPEGRPGEITVEDGRLVLHFSNYKNLEGRTKAEIAPDLKGLLFR